mmetsp:Transcript_80392/g.222390  ORF Transcript_80392/g.222390 Transcript_80392/m.222390 type:complete len:352 (+) Transcript_80392:439-1494(+)
MLHVNPLGHVKDFGVTDHLLILLNIIRLNLPVFQPVGNRKRNGVDGLQCIVWSPVVQEQSLLEAPDVHMLHLGNVEALRLLLARLKTRQSRMSPAASGPLLVVGEIHFDTLTEVLAKFLGIGQMGPVRREAALREVRAEAPSVGTPRDSLLHHGGELHAAILSGLGSEILGKADSICHLLVSEVKQLAHRRRRTGRAPAAGALAWAARLADPHGLADADVVADGHSLKDLWAAASELRTNCKDCWDNDGSWMSLRTPMPIVHVKQGTGVRIEEDRTLHFQFIASAPYGVSACTIDALEHLDDTRHRLVRRSREGAAEQVNDSALGEVLCLWCLVCPFKVLDILHDRAVCHC